VADIAIAEDSANHVLTDESNTDQLVVSEVSPSAPEPVLEPASPQAGAASDHLASDHLIDEPPFDVHAPAYHTDDQYSNDKDQQAVASTQPVQELEIVDAVPDAIIPEPAVEAVPAVTPEAVEVTSMAAAQIQSEPAPQTQPEPVEIDMTLSPASWALIFDHLPVEGMLRNLVANSCLIQMNGNELLFHGDSGHMRLFSATHQQRFNEILNQTLQVNYTLQVIDGPLLHETPAQRAQRLTAEKQLAAVESIENDPNVHAIRQAFDAQVIMESITPLH
jgi:DNA polymerase-3 subunit gamma/tau